MEGEGGGWRRGVVAAGMQTDRRTGTERFCANKVKSVLSVAYLTLLCFNDKDQIGPGFTLAPEKQ